jgi:hypothetical protein
MLYSESHDVAVSFTGAVYKKQHYHHGNWFRNKENGKNYMNL